MDDPTDFRKRLDAARAELLAARVNYISEDSYESTEDAPPIVSKSARAARASGNQCWQEHRKAFVAVIDCSERVLACVDETIERYVLPGRCHRCRTAVRHDIPKGISKIMCKTVL